MQKNFILATVGGMMLLGIIIGYVFWPSQEAKPELPQEVSTAPDSVLPAKSQNPVAHNDVFQNIFSDKNGSVTTHGALVAAWEVDEKLAYILANSEDNTFGVFYDGKEIYRSKYALKVAYNISDKLAYYTAGQLPTGERKFFYGDKIYPLNDILDEAISINGKLAMITGGKILLEEKIIEKASVGVKLRNLMNVGGKLAYIRDDNKTPLLIWDGKEVSRLPLNYAGGTQKVVVDLNGVPAFISLEHLESSPQGKSFVVSGGQPISEKYDAILDLGVVGGQIAFLADLPSRVLIWGGNVLGNNYDHVVAYSESNGTPIFVAYNDVRDGDKSNYFIVQGEEVIYQGEEGEKWNVGVQSRIVDAGGRVAVTIGFYDQKGNNSHNYLYFNGKRFFEDQRFSRIFDVGGKLAVMVHDENFKNSLFLEK